MYNKLWKIELSANFNAALHRQYKVEIIGSTKSIGYGRTAQEAYSKAEHSLVTKPAFMCADIPQCNEDQ